TRAGGVWVARGRAFSRLRIARDATRQRRRSSSPRSDAMQEENTRGDESYSDKLRHAQRLAPEIVCGNGHRDIAQRDAGKRQAYGKLFDGKDVEHRREGIGNEADDGEG